MKISIRNQGDVAIVSLEGKFSASADGPILRNKAQELFDSGTKKMVLDFTGVPYIDSTGLGFLAASHAAAEKAQAKMVLCGLAPPVRQILDRVQMAQFFPLVRDQAAALALFAAPAGAP
ncbi:MAG TPA: STAS domain-containing protein [Terriglobia bacterium]|nr:STAS domain-containing protein [Terriglobia bacterium]